MFAKKSLSGLLFPALIFGIWWWGSSRGWWNAFILPSPSRVWAAAVDLLSRGILLSHIRTSLFRVLGGCSLAFAMAFPLGALCGRSPLLRSLVLPSLEALRHIPPLAVLPLLILWFGIGETSKLMVIILASFFPIFLNTLSGISQVNRQLLEVGASLKLSSWETFRHILLPGSFPSVLVGLRLGLGYGWRSLIGAELIAAASGMGYMIHHAEQLSRTDVVIVGVLLMGALGSLMDGLFFTLTRHLLPWKGAHHDPLA